METLTKVRINELTKNGRIIIFNNHLVYDITELIDIHPGGGKCLINKKMKNCKRDYDFHTALGKKTWEKYLIGIREKRKFLKFTFCCL